MKIFGNRIVRNLAKTTNFRGEIPKTTKVYEPTTNLMLGKDVKL